MLDSVDGNQSAQPIDSASSSLGQVVSYTVSARAKQMVGRSNQSIVDYLRTAYVRLSLDQIDSVFGFVERSTLYGGRPFVAPELSDPDVWALYDYGIGLRLPISNSIVNRDEFLAAKDFLGKYHRDGNSVIVSNDDLASWIREEFPLFKIEASAIKNIDNLRKLKKAFTHYDTVVLPAKSNDDVGFLESIKPKNIGVTH